MHRLAVGSRSPAEGAGRRTRVSELEFVGCDPVRVSEAEFESPTWEGRRVEYWHGASETAWIMREAVSLYHEGPAARLAQLVRQIGIARGSEVRCIGATDLRFREADGSLGDIMQADQALYLDPDRAELSEYGKVIVGEDELPDVLLEVDNTTDVRRGKLIAYADWRLPEVWVEVPDRGSPSRPRGLRPGLRIYLLDEGGYRESKESRAFPGWTATEIHRALNETRMSEATESDLWRVGRGLGDREGTVAEDDRLALRLMLMGRTRAFAEGHTEGMEEGRAEALARTALSILRRRGVEASEERIPAAVRGASADAVVAAALAARHEADFLSRLR